MTCKDIFTGQQGLLFLDIRTLSTKNCLLGIVYFQVKKKWVKKESIVYVSTNLTMMSVVTHYCWVKVITGAAVLNCHKGS